MATIKDIAERAGVALSTASYAISGNRPISREVRERVYMAMEELGYQPNAMARALAGKGTRILGMLFDPIDRSLGVTEIEILSRAAEAARSLGYHLTLLTDDSRNPAVLEEIIAGRLFDGFILMEVQEKDERAGFLSERGIPCVTIGQCEGSPPAQTVDIDFSATAEEVLDHIAREGHGRAGFINQSRQAFRRGYGPAVAMKNALESLSRERGVELISLFCPPGKAEGEGAVKKLLSGNPGITALMVMNDQALPGVIKGLSDMDLSVPGDISLISLLSSSKLAGMFHPALTYAAIPSRILGKESVGRLVAILEGRQEGEEKILVPGKLCLGESTKG